MSDEAINALINAISKPSCAEIVMLILTSLYLAVTVCVYFANRRMAKAAENQISTATKMSELSKNVDLLDKRLALLNKARELNKSRNDTEAPSFLNEPLLLEFNVLFYDESVQCKYKKFIKEYEIFEQASHDLEYFRENGYLGQIDYRDLSDAVEEAIRGSLSTSEVEDIKKRSESLSISSTDEITGESKKYNYYELAIKSQSAIATAKEALNSLLETMERFIESSVGNLANN